MIAVPQLPRLVLSLLSKAICLWLVTSCGLVVYTRPGGSNQGGNRVPPPSESTVSFSVVMNEVIAPSCIQCHSRSNAAGGISYSTYADTLQSVSVGRPEESLLYLSLRSATNPMPPSGALPSALRDLVFTWISQGAPEFTHRVTSLAPTSGPRAGGTLITLAGANFSAGMRVNFGAIPCTEVRVVSSRSITCRTGQSPAAAVVDVSLLDAQGGAVTLSGGFTYLEGSTPPSTATFAKVNADILQRRCASCHNDNRALAGVSYSNYATTLATGGVVPAKPDESALYYTVSGNAPTMPPSGKLTSGEADLVRRWISEGAKNN